MSEQRNDYGFPCLMWLSNEKHMWAYMPASQPTKLERAQAIAAEVRARKFPPVQKITAKEE